jgi:hypothetical protein
MEPTYEKKDSSSPERDAEFGGKTYEPDGQHVAAVTEEARIEFETTHRGLKAR